MKILTINTHSLVEDNYETKLDIFINAIYRIRPDIIAMQEVNQTMSQSDEMLCEEFDLRCDNHVLRVCEKLSEMGLKYNFVWQGIKEAYGRFEEGIAIMSYAPISDTDSFTISDTNDKRDCRRRMALGIKVGGEWFYCVHTGRYDDKKDPFDAQFQRLNSRISEKGRTWILGDFNCDADSEGYKTVTKSGWYDTFNMANKRDCGVTVRGKIDGWRDDEVSNLRIDYIFCNENVAVKSSKVIFNGKNEKIISDHYGVLIEVE